MILFREIYTEHFKEMEMDKQINKIKHELDRAEKDTNKLLKMDKKQDKKLDRIEKKKGKK